ARATTLRLGYDYEEVERVEEELGETETSTYRIALQSRLSKQLSGRISYEYQDIDDPFHGEDMTGIAQGIGITDPLYPGMAWLNTDDFRLIDDNPLNNAVYYWNSVYPNRTLDTSTSPDEVQQIKFSTTWSPSTNMALTAFARYRAEENDDVSYEQKTFVPGLSLYYAPNSKLNLTMAYTFNKQETENQMCVGWYHG
ncbi:MAG: MtrB/PioB family outer membrane beta-barrel protein, partial [Desulfuromonadales bacterium]|nr:MtrB/PioB family outer membrane beta-barrel protein [Desulfuromonadales bacterium]